MDGGGWAEAREAEQRLESCERHRKALIYNQGKVDAEFKQVIGLLTECRNVLHQIRCHDTDFYQRICPGLIEAIETHLPRDERKYS